MTRTQICKELLQVSKINLALIMDEDWRKWEALTKQKEELFYQLEELKGAFDKEDRKLVEEITRSEKEAKDVLFQKLETTKQELGMIKKAKGALKGYGKTARNNSKRSSFKIRV